MSSMWIFLGYGLPLALALCLLYFFHARAWYWHILSLGCALGLGMMPAQAAWQSPLSGLILGAAFVFLVVWGVGGLLVVPAHHAKHA